MKKRERFRAAQAIRDEVDALFATTHPCPPKHGQHTWQTRLGSWLKMDRLRGQSLYTSAAMPPLVDEDDWLRDFETDERELRRAGEIEQDAWGGHYYDDMADLSDYDSYEPDSWSTPDPSSPEWVDYWLSGDTDADVLSDGADDYYDDDDDDHFYDWRYDIQDDLPQDVSDHYSTDVERKRERLKAGERYYRQHKRAAPHGAQAVG